MVSTGPELLFPAMLSADLSGDVAPDVLHKAREVGDVFRREQQMVVIAHKAETKELHIKSLNSPCQYAND